MADKITRGALERKMAEAEPDNADKRKGYALVNVLGEDSFREEHIPGSINIPKGHEEDFEKRFAKEKEIIVYCASPECPASPTVAEELTRRGFRHVFDYEDGMSEWKKAENDVVGEAA